MESDTVVATRLFEVQLPVRAQVYTMSQGRALTAFHALTLDAPERMAAETTRMRGEGYRCWQLKLSSEPAADADRLRAVRRRRATRRTL